MTNISPHGGSLITVTGKGLHSNRINQISSDSCIVTENTGTTIVCETLPSAIDNAVELTFTYTLDNCFGGTYDYVLGTGETLTTVDMTPIVKLDTVSLNEVTNQVSMEFDCTVNCAALQADLAAGNFAMELLLLSGEEITTTRQGSTPRVLL